MQSGSKRNTRAAIMMFRGPVLETVAENAEPSREGQSLCLAQAHIVFMSTNKARWFYLKYVLTRELLFGKRAEYIHRGTACAAQARLR
mmetsp:Transcript_4882/g.13101  ORF Transcript_4882/g.13101 Transcript_4882/m.13101 type:complete len:88 (+) Transcript_4882:71-334(+)